MTTMDSIVILGALLVTALGGFGLIYFMIWTFERLSRLRSNR